MISRKKNQTSVELRSQHLARPIKQLRVMLRNKAGQAILESCLAIFLICLVFAGVFQVSQIYAAREILCHASARAARAKTVGFNRWMVKKVARVASIPNAGRMITPALIPEDRVLQAALQRHMSTDNGQTRTPGLLWMKVLSGEIKQPATLVNLEIARIPEYLWSPDASTANNILDYENWDTVIFRDLSSSGAPGGDMIHIKVSQLYPLQVPLHRAFYATDDNSLLIEDGTETYIENHYNLFINDENW